MLSKVQKYIDSLSSIPHLEALQEACQLFEKEREPWKIETENLRRLPNDINFLNDLSLSGSA